MVVIPIWGRRHISQQAIDWYKSQGHEIVVVGSEGEISKSLAHDVFYVEAPNHPLDAKFDIGIEFCKRFAPDMVSLVGSDDFITADYFRWAKTKIRSGFDLVGFLDFYLTDFKLNKIYYWGGYNGKRRGESIGAGRIFSKKILDAVEWKPFLTDGRYHHILKDDERAIQNIQSKIECKSIFINMANIGCRYWAVKTGNEINKTTAFLDQYHMVEVTEYTKRLFQFDFARFDLDFPPEKQKGIKLI